MKQVEISKSGGINVLKIIENKIPSPQQGEVLIKVKYAGINFADVVMRQGLYKLAPKPPFVPGFEVSGIVSSTGPNVTEFKKDDLVLAATFFGGYSEYICVPSSQVRKIPAGINLAEAAAFPAVYMTAWLALKRVAPKPGETILIHAAAGGLGTAIIQIAKHLKLKIIGTASTNEKLAFAKTQGLDIGINYSNKNFCKEVLKHTNGRGADICIDSVAGSILKDSYKSLALGGRLVILGAANLWPKNLFAWIKTIYNFLTTKRFKSFELINKNCTISGLQLLGLWKEDFKLDEDLDELMKLLESGAIKPVIDKVFPVEQVKEAHKYIEDRKTKGKIVLEF